jgi:hypothetical protein
MTLLDRSDLTGMTVAKLLRKFSKINVFALTPATDADKPTDIGFDNDGMNGCIDDTIEITGQRGSFSGRRRAGCHLVVGRCNGIATFDSEESPLICLWLSMSFLSTT